MSSILVAPPPGVKEIPPGAGESIAANRAWGAARPKGDGSASWPGRDGSLTGPRGHPRMRCSARPARRNQNDRKDECLAKVNDFNIHVATVNGSGSQTANTTLLRAIFQM